jgi:hypothetical protein
MLENRAALLARIRDRLGDDKEHANGRRQVGGLPTPFSRWTDPAGAVERPWGTTGFIGVVGMQRQRHGYTDSARADALAALAANGGNFTRTAAQLGIPRRTLQHWAKGECAPQVRELAQQKKGPLADAFEELARELLGGMTPEKMAAATLQQLATAAGIAVDKMQLLRGQPTTITEMTDEERDAQIRKLGAELGYFTPKEN